MNEHSRLKMFFVELWILISLTVLVCSCSASLKDMSFHGAIDIEQGDIKEEIGFDAKL